MRYIDNNLVICQTEAPEPEDNQVLVNIKAFGINRADLLQRQGKYPPPPNESTILGLEIVGQVETCGKNVERWKPGDLVMGLVAGGGYAERVAVHKDHLMAVPSTLTVEQAAGLTEIFLTAFQSLSLIAKIQARQRVLIHAGASGVGLACIQMVKFFGCECAVTVSNGHKASVCKKLGADLVIDYTEEDFVTSIKSCWNDGVDIIVDVVCGNYISRNLDVIRPDGRIVCLSLLGGRHAERIDIAKVLAKRVTIAGSTLRNRSDAYKTNLICQFQSTVLPSFAEGKLSVPIDSVYAVENIAQAHGKMQANQTTGKLIGYW